MATATHYDAFDLLEHMFNRAQHQPQSQRCAPSRKEAPASVETRLIRMDVSESEQAYTVLAELPGVKKEQLEVRIEGKHVYIQGQVVPTLAEAATSVPNAGSTNAGSANPANANPANATAPERQLLNERFYGKLERRIQLPLEIDEAQAQAKFADGILQLQLPKKRLAGAHKLEIL